MQLNLEDICQNRHGGADTSQAANALVNKDRDQERIYSLITQSEHGLTIHDLCFQMNRQPNQISGRLTELREAGRIYFHGRRCDHNGRFGRIYFPTQ